MQQNISNYLQPIFTAKIKTDGANKKEEGKFDSTDFPSQN
jgi:hypothetical protein